MASLLNNASLLLNPAGSIIAYEEDKILSVLPSNGTGDFTFSGGDGGTRVNQQGYIEQTPFNLFQYSIRSQHAQLMDSDNLNWNSRLTNTFPIKGNWNIQVASRYIGASNTVQGRSEGYFTANGSVRKSFNKKQMC